VTVIAGCVRRSVMMARGTRTAPALANQPSRTVPPAVGRPAATAAD
jgi:hypothetical protein